MSIMWIWYGTFQTNKLKLWNSKEKFCYCEGESMFLEGYGCVLECPGDYFNKNDEECIPCVENCMDCESETCE